jgi:hypothetical protein
MNKNSGGFDAISADQNPIHNWFSEIDLTPQRDAID